MRSAGKQSICRHLERSSSDTLEAISCTDTKLKPCAQTIDYMTSLRPAQPAFKSRPPSDLMVSSPYQDAIGTFKPVWTAGMQKPTGASPHKLVHTASGIISWDC